MIEFKTRGIGDYMNLEIKVDNTHIDLGLMSQDEILELMNILEDARDDFARYYIEKYEP